MHRLVEQYDSIANATHANLLNLLKLSQTNSDFRKLTQTDSTSHATHVIMGELVGKRKDLAVKMMTTSFVLNGKPVTAEVEAGSRLVDLLRSKFKLCGTKVSCEQGECGACTVLMNNEAVHSCMVLAAQADGSEITTIEGLAKDGKMDPIQQAFVDCGAVQCGFCTPGMVMSVKGLLLKKPKPTEDEIKEALAGNICRCTGYLKILDAVKRVTG